jgi:hypothetical protein
MTTMMKTKKMNLRVERMNLKTRNNRTDEKAEVTAADDTVLAAAPDLPAALASALTEASAVLVQYDRLHGVLTATHASIPEALASERELTAKLGGAEIAGGDVGSLRSRLVATTSEREAAARQRSAAAEAVLGMEGELARVRAQVATAEATLASGILKEFWARWRAAVDALAAMYSEGLALADALHVRIDTASELRRLLAPAPSPAAAALPAAVAAAASAIQKLDAGITLCGGIRQSKEIESRAWSLSQVRRVPFEVTGTYRTLRSVHCMTDGQQFPAGSLVDASLLGHGFLGRLATARHIVPVELDVAHRAA